MKAAEGENKPWKQFQDILRQYEGKSGKINANLPQKEYTYKHVYSVTNIASFAHFPFNKYCKTSETTEV